MNNHPKTTRDPRAWIISPVLNYTGIDKKTGEVVNREMVLPYEFYQDYGPNDTNTSEEHQNRLLSLLEDVTNISEWNISLKETRREQPIEEVIKGDLDEPEKEPGLHLQTKEETIQRLRQYILQKEHHRPFVLLTDLDLAKAKK